MNFYLLGTSYKETSIEIRELFTINSEEYPLLFKKIIDLKGVEDVIIISTCNRTELYCMTSNNETSLATIQETFLRFKKCKKEEEIIFFQYEGLDVIKHLFQVVTSLDSMILGEVQILGQVKDAYQFSEKLNPHYTSLKTIFQYAFSTAKLVHNNTQLFQNTLSVGYASVCLAQKIFDTLHNKQALIIGTGEIAELTIKYLKQKGISQLFIANRTFSKATEIAQKYNASVIQFELITQYLTQVDIIITATNSKKYILDYGEARKNIKRRCNPLFIIDLAVPRDVDPNIGKIDDIFLYNIDDLQNIIAENKNSRINERKKADKIIEEQMQKLLYRLHSIDKKEVITSFRNKYHQIFNDEADKLFQKNNFHSLQNEDIKKFTYQLLQKFLHFPTIYLYNNNNIDEFIKIFSLEENIPVDKQNSKKKTNIIPFINTNQRKE